MLFVVAAYPSAGKTTALALSRYRKVRLFGPSLDSRFRAALKSSAPIDEGLPTDEKLRNGMWLTFADCPAFEAIDPKPEDLIFHFDLLLFLIASIRPKRLSDMDQERVSSAFRQWFEEPLASCYPEIAVNTLFPEFDQLKAQWQDRERNRGAEDDYIWSVKNDLIANIPDPSGFYQAVIEEWHRTAETRTVFNVVSRFPRVKDSGASVVRSPVKATLISLQ